MPKVHQQEGQVIEDVDVGYLVVEFDAVEQARLAIEHADVAQMQIAMAPAHLARGFPAVEQFGMPREGDAEGLGKGPISAFVKTWLVAKPASLMSSTPAILEEPLPWWTVDAARWISNDHAVRRRSSGRASALQRSPSGREASTGRSEPFRSLHRPVLPYAIRQTCRRPLA